MSKKVFNRGKPFVPGRTFLLVDPNDGSKQFRIPPKGIVDVPDNFLGDITFRMGVEAGELVFFEESGQVDAMLKKDEAAGKEKPAGAGKSGRNKAESAASEPVKTEE